MSAGTFSGTSTQVEMHMHDAAGYNTEPSHNPPRSSKFAALWKKNLLLANLSLEILQAVTENMLDWYICRIVDTKSVSYISKTGSRTV
jgi:hypothetical protein